MAEEGTDEVRVEIPQELFNRNVVRGHREDLDAFRREGFDVDDDNEPAPENVPQPVPQEGGVCFCSHQEAQILAEACSWRHDGHVHEG